MLKTPILPDAKLGFLDGLSLPLSGEGFLFDILPQFFYNGTRVKKKEESEILWLS